MSFFGPKEPKHKPCFAQVGDWKIYGDGYVAYFECSPTKVTINSYDVTHVLKRRGWVDLDDYR